MEKVYARTKGIQPDMVDGFCPGCMHSTLFKLIGEVLEEMNMLDKCTCAIGVGCCGLGMGYFTYDYLLAAHGRACAVATGAKRSNPETLVFTYQGDGDLASIGLAETMSAANRGENISVIFVNNGIYGMTGGQLAPTTLVGMKATTAPKGRDPKEHGYPMHVCEILNQLTAPYYLERTSCNNPANVAKTKAAIRKAFQNGTVLTVCSQCPQGAVSLGAYETSSALKKAGAVSGLDMTTEAAVAKLYYLFSLNLGKEEIKRAMEQDLRGEITVL